MNGWSCWEEVEMEKTYSGREDWISDLPFDEEMRVVQSDLVSCYCVLGNSIPFILFLLSLSCW